MVDELFITISFALLHQEKNSVEVCSNWQISDDEVGIFLISSNSALVGDCTINVLQNEKEIYASHIRKAPDTGLPLPFEGENIYISSRVLTSQDISGDNGIAEIILLDNENKLLAEAVITIEDLRENIDKPLINEKEEVKCEVIEEIDEAEEEVQVVEGIVEGIVEETTEEVVEENCEIELEEDESSQNDVDSVEDFNCLKRNIVIEQINDYYVTLLNGFENKPQYFMYNDQPMLNWDRSIEEYVEWIEDSVGRMYNIAPVDMKSIRKIIITIDDNCEKCNLEEHNVRYMNKLNILSNFSE